MNSRTSYQRAYYLKNKKRILAEHRKRKQEIDAYNKLYYAENKEKENKRGAEWKKENATRVKTYNKKYKRDNKNKLLQQKKQYCANNKEKVRIWKQNESKRIANNPMLRLRYDVSASIRRFLAKRGVSKSSAPTWKHLPYSKEVLRIHIESLFESWMSWDNWGVYNSDTWDDNNPATWTWQLDHIIPHSKFNYTSMKNKTFKKCWSLENLRPYSAKQNVIDGSRRVKAN